MDFIATSRVIWAAKFAILLSLLGVLIAISQSSLMAVDDLIPTALAIDFLVTLPIAYVFLIRKTSVPKITVVPVFFASFLIASGVLPDGIAFMTLVAGFMIPVLELGGVGFLVFRVYRARKAYREGFDVNSDLMERLRTALTKEIKPGAIARAAAFELGILVYVFIKWRRVPVEGNVFTSHRASSPHLIVAVLLFLLAVETIGIHLLFSLWSQTLAWVATALSIYLAFQLFAHLKALLLRQVILTDMDLYIRCGILADARIPRELIASVEAIGSEGDAVAPGVDVLPLGGMSQPNVRLTLSEPVTVYKVYGMKEAASVIRLSIDGPEKFVEAIREKA